MHINVTEKYVVADVDTLKQKKKKKIKQEKIGEIQKEGNFAVQPSDKIAKLDTSQWPLLLKVSFILHIKYVCVTVNRKVNIINI